MLRKAEYLIQDHTVRSDAVEAYTQVYVTRCAFL